MGGKIDITWKVNTAVTEHAAIAISGSSQSTTAMGAQTYAVRLCSTGACHYLISSKGAAATANSAYLPANVAEIVSCAPGDIVSVIRDGAATGNFIATEMTH